MTTFFSDSKFADLGIRDAIKTALGRALSAAHVARSRQRTHDEYRQLLIYEDHLLNDAGITREEIHQALRECGGRCRRR